MSDAEVAAEVVRRLETALEVRLGATGPDAAAKLASVAGQLPEEIVLQAEYLVAVRDRMAAEPDHALGDSTALDRMATEVLAHLAAMPERARFRDLPRLRAEPRHRRSPPGPPPPFRGARGWTLWLLILAVLVAMAASLWL